MLRIAVVIAFILALGEIAVRVIGLGTPPLWVTHPAAEYMLAPDQDVLRFGRRVLVNHWSMRSPPIPPEKAQGEERVLVLGDSVLNGGTQIDHAELATTLLSTGTIRALHVSASSWGPGNMLGYLKSFGFFEADRIVLVLSSHDATDVPGFGPLDPITFPSKTPVSALAEGLGILAARHLPAHSASEQVAKPARSALPDLADLLALASAQAPVCVVLHATRHELRSGRFDEGHSQIANTARRLGARVVSDAALVDVERSYRDDIHLNAAGQAHLAAAIRQCLTDAPPA